MAGVAKEAGVSRQLVYEHFSDLPSLASALVYDRFSKFDAAIDATLTTAISDGPAAALTAARLVLSLSAQERHIVRTLLAHASLPQHELSALAARLRARMIKRWTTAIETPTSPHARSLVWALLHALFALGDLVDAEEITIEQALKQFEHLLAGGALESQTRAR
jgi:AcrR family transcriptional regulator